MNGRKAKSLRRKAHNLFATMREDLKKKTSERYIYRWLKKEYKNDK